MSKTLKIIGPLLVLLVCILLAVLLVKQRAPLETKPAVRTLPVVEVIQAELQPMQLTVRSQGNVVARNEIQLTSEVSGAVSWVSDRFYVGQRVTQGERLLKIDPTDYRSALAERVASLREAELNLAEERARVRQAAEDCALVSEEPATELTLRKPQLAVAEARVEAARAKVQQAEKDLQRTGLYAPFNGIINQKRVDLGQFVTKGTVIASLLGTDAVEVRLPVPPSAFALIRSASEGHTHRVELTEPGDSRSPVWHGVLSRIESQLDPVTRVHYVVVTVEDPYRLVGEQGEPLRVGTFVEARMEGIILPNGARIPRRAINGQQQAFIMDENNRLQLRQLEVAQFEADSAIVSAGLEQGDRVVLTKLDAEHLPGEPVELVQPAQVHVLVVDGEQSALRQQSEDAVHDLLLLGRCVPPLQLHLVAADDHAHHPRRGRQHLCIEAHHAHCA